VTTDADLEHGEAVRGRLATYHRVAENRRRIVAAREEPPSPDEFRRDLLDDAADDLERLLARAEKAEAALAAYEAKAPHEAIAAETEYTMQLIADNDLKGLLLMWPNLLPRSADVR
jgi:hypothetical protein